VTFLARAFEIPWFRPVAGAARSGPTLGFTQWLAAEIAAERDRWFPWAIACFGFGSLLYFVLSSEPPLWLALLLLMAGLAIALAARRSDALLPRFLCLCLDASCFGFAAAKLRTEIVAAPVITSDRVPVTTEGRIETVLMEDATNARIVLLPTRIGDESENLPHRLRLTLRGSAAVASVAPGLNVSVLAMLRPPPEPALPGGYDFARWAFFEGIGGVGFVLGTPERLDAAPAQTWRTRFQDCVERLRRNMSARIQSVLPGSDGAIAAALITGERAAIPEEDNNAYRDSGLFHVLSISGVHMALAGLGIFWIIRALLALSPRLALLYPIKKWAAVAAILAATFYLFLSGASAPAVRSWIMLLVMLVGVLADRPVLSMRSVAISAALILLAEPESIIDPSFQMSFAAIIGLIALAEWQRKLAPPDIFPETSLGWVTRWIRRYNVGMLLASFIAGLATAPFAIFHFDRAPGYSLLANLLATPIVGVVIMPFA
jgi:competence protein ComEC